MAAIFRKSSAHVSTPAWYSLRDHGDFVDFTNRKLREPQEFAQGQQPVANGWNRRCFSRAFCYTDEKSNNTPSLAIELAQLTDGNMAEELSRSLRVRRGSWGMEWNKTTKSTSWSGDLTEMHVYNMKVLVQQHSLILKEFWLVRKYILW